MQPSKQNPDSNDFGSQELPGTASEEFEDIEVNGCKVKVSKSGMRREVHLELLKRYESCQRCLKLICRFQKLLISRGYYMLDSKTQKMKIYDLEGDLEIQNEHMKRTSSVELILLLKRKISWKLESVAYNSGDDP
jgi:hypothetical protein